MKVILLHDTPGLGKKYDVKEVANGYARNFLLPFSKAKIATEGVIKMMEVGKKRAEQEKNIHEDILNKNLESIDGARVIIEEKVNEKGHLFAGIHKEEITKILKDQKHIEIPSDSIELGTPIKEVGEYKIKVGEKKFTLEVVGRKD